jgi:hypothetical protein
MPITAKTIGTSHVPHAATTTFLALATLTHLLLTWLWNPDYGGQRDWDLFSLAAIPATVLFAQRLAQRWAENGHTPAPTTVPTTATPEDSPMHSLGQASAERMEMGIAMAGIIPLLVLQYLHTAAWIYQNTLPWDWP